MRCKTYYIVIIVILLLFLFILFSFRRPSYKSTVKTEAEVIDTIQSYFRPHFDIIVIDPEILSEIQSSHTKVSVSTAFVDSFNPSHRQRHPISLGIVRNVSFSDTDDFILYQECTLMGSFVCIPMQSRKSSRVTHLFLQDKTEGFPHPVAHVVVLRRVFEETLIIDALNLSPQTHLTMFGASGIELFDDFDIQTAFYYSVYIKVPKPIESFLSQVKISRFMACNTKEVTEKQSTDLVRRFTRIIFIIKLFLKSIDAEPIVRLANSSLTEYQESCVIHGGSGLLQFSSMPLTNASEDWRTNNFLHFLEKQVVVDKLKVSQSYASFIVVDIPHITVHLSFDVDKKEQLCSVLLYNQRVNVPCDVSLARQVT